jgi:hypothetical protein
MVCNMRLSDGVIWQNELAQHCVEAGAGRYRSVAEAPWFGIRIGVESSLWKASLPGQNPALLSSCECASRVTASGNRAKSWTLSWVADAKRSATGNSRRHVREHPPASLTTLEDLRSAFNTFKKTARV